MKPVRAPRPDEIRVGAKFGGVTIHSGKHGEGDFQVRWHDVPVSYNELSALIVALYMAEERYRLQGKRGGEYFVAALLSPTIHWIRNHLDKPMALPNPNAPLGLLEDD